MRSRRIGKFSVTEDFINYSPDTVAEVFAMMKLIPVRAEMMWHSRAIEYVAISDKFEEVEDGCMTPEYTLEITQEDGKVKNVVAKKC